MNPDAPIIRRNITDAGTIIDDLHWNMLGRAVWRDAMIALMSSSQRAESSSWRAESSSRRRVPLSRDVCRIIGEYIRPRVRICDPMTPVLTDQRATFRITAPTSADIDVFPCGRENSVDISGSSWDDVLHLAIYDDSRRMRIGVPRDGYAKRVGPITGRLIWRSFDIARHLLAPIGPVGPRDCTFFLFTKNARGEWLVCWS